MVPGTYIGIQDLHVYKRMLGLLQLGISDIQYLAPGPSTASN